MRKITVKVTFEGKNYQTNIITNEDITDDETIRLAREQIRKQLTFIKNSQQNLTNSI
ncbi:MULTISPECIES: BA3454 family stress response protein [Bacillus cereus group]|uniref:Molecular chaperone n=1 Tax=Bacillus bombysepticus str. Wang TaxID=1330043 RepID=A0A9W3PTZ7_9BACI|nr:MULTISPECIES: BA3454 family stress response protein [Bacillus cereus group]AHX21655.1 molecular chaperone [Bacillus bombysepticus str. Wang]MCE9758246.1 BA3454 family stress response protein [Bacillus cereus]HDR7992360.1 BA3454 family stress response protein [Bacillus cereus]